MKFIKYFILLLVLYCVPVTAQCANLHIIKKAGGDIFISSKMDNETDILYWFKRCMFNDIFTFYRVGMLHNNGVLPVSNPDTVPDTVLNLTVSDNIGPFDIESGGWCGGNHAYTDGTSRTAATESVYILADGVEINNDTVAYACDIKIKVRNYILNPVSAEQDRGVTSFGDTLCEEKVEYNVRRNNIQVEVSHRYMNKIPVTVTRYYGMQSVFCNEKEVLTPGGEYRDWTNIREVSRFKKHKYRDFRRFIEKSSYACQSAYLCNYGLGNHSEVPDDDVVFIGNSSGKCYHKLISGSKRKNGCTDLWKGVYTWFRKPLYDDEHLYVYEGMLDGYAALYISGNGARECKVELPPGLAARKFRIIEAFSSVKVSKISNNIITVSSGKNAGCIILFDN